MAVRKTNPVAQALYDVYFVNYYGAQADKPDYAGLLPAIQEVWEAVAAEAVRLAMPAFTEALKTPESEPKPRNPRNPRKPAPADTVSAPAE